MVALIKIYFKFAKSQLILPKIIQKHDFIASQQQLFKEKPKHFFDVKNHLSNHENKSKPDKKQTHRIKNLSKCDDKLNVEPMEKKHISAAKKKASVDAPEFVNTINS